MRGINISCMGYAHVRGLLCRRWSIYGVKFGGGQYVSRRSTMGLFVVLYVGMD